MSDAAVDSGQDVAADRGTDVEAGAVDAVESGLDAGDVVARDQGAQDAVEIETAVGGSLGALCSTDGQCTSGICLSIGRCTQTCASGADCPASSNWQCVALPGRGTACDCTPSGSTDVPCNGIDDECNGVIDDSSRTCSGACVDISTDNANCGNCGIVCGGGTICAAGICSCPSSHPTICGTRCVDLQTDPANCGTCAHTCSSTSMASAACVAGMCSIACSPGYGDCDANPANGCETALTSDTANCGACGNVCSFTNATTACVTGTCLLTGCSSGFANCDSDPSNGCESNTSTDVANCGGCGATCSAPHAVSDCTGGVCGLAACDTGYANCDTLISNGCEVDLQTDTNNCGLCMHVCPSTGGANTLATCSSGACGTNCVSGYADCDANPANGCEALLASDSLNCGACGHACPSGQSCGGGVCSICPSGMTLCGSNCTTTSSDPLNCGACGNICGGGTICSAGVCVANGPQVTCPTATSTNADTAVTLTATASSPGQTITSYAWSVTAAPNGGASTVIWSPNPPSGASVTFAPRVVGSYTVHLVVTDSMNQSASCDTTVDSLPHGLRLELTWDGAGDLDLHLHNGVTTTPWFAANDCYYANCESFGGPAPVLDWDAAGIGPDDPWLELDNVTGNGPELTHIDAPVVGESYTVGVHDYNAAAGRIATVTIYCGTSATPTVVVSRAFTGTQNGNCTSNDFWKAAQVVFASASSCTVTSLATYETSMTACGAF